MTVKAIYEDGVLKPRTPLPLKEHEEVELEIKTSAQDVDDDARSFVGFIKTAPIGEPVARDHDKYLDK